MYRLFPLINPHVLHMRYQVDSSGPSGPLQES